MQFSTFDINIVKEYLRIDTDEEDNLTTLILMASKSFIKGYTGLTVEELDLLDDMPICILSLCAEMYDNRQYTVDKNNVNPVIKTILNMYSKNLL